MADRELSDDERMVLRAIESSPDGQVAEDDLKVMMRWSREVELYAAMRKCVLDGKLKIAVQNGEVALAMTELGRESAARLLQRSRRDPPTEPL